MKDELVRAMTKDGFVNAVAVTTTGIVERARQIHKTLPTATAALGRLSCSPVFPVFVRPPPIRAAIAASL